MQPKIIVSKNREERNKLIWELLDKFEINQTNPDILTLEEEKIGIEDVKRIRKHLASKPFGSTAKSVVIFDGNNISLDAQNALLKTLEEPPGETIILIGVDSENKLLPTVLSRCLVISYQQSAISSQPSFNLNQLLETPIEERFEIVEKASDREQLLKDLTESYREKVLEGKVKSGFLEELLKAQAWKESNVNIRTILEYLMLKLH